MTRLRFDAFGRELIVTATGWTVLEAGNEGKHRPANIAIPPETAPEEIATCLDELLHEYATPARPNVRRIA